MINPYNQFKVGYENLKMQMKYMRDSESLIKKIASDMKGDNDFILIDDIYINFLNNHDDSRKRTTRTQYLYKLTIISLYGLFEQFIESQIEQYAKLISKQVGKYIYLPEKMQSIHCDLTLKYAQKNLDNKYLSDEDKENNHKLLVTSLYQSLNNDTNDFSLFEKVYSNHTSNFRYDLINNLFANIGIERIIDKTLSIDGYDEYYKQFFGLDDSAKHNEIITKVSEEILGIVQRRNRIAHGENEDNMLSYELLQEKCNFFDKICNGIYCITEREFEYHLISIEMRKHKSFKLIKPTKYFPRESVLGFSLKKLDSLSQGKYIYIGQKIYVKYNGLNKIERYFIESIFYNGKKDSIFITSENFEFGIKLKDITDLGKLKDCEFFFTGD